MKRIELLTFFALFFLLLLRGSVLEPGCDNSSDVFYHVTMADLGPTFYMSKELPFLELSNWKENFSDKELMFHLILSGIRKFKDISGISLAAPFHLEYLFFATLFILTLFTVCRYFGIKHIYLYAFAIISCSPFFMDRILVLRPHLFAITILLISSLLFYITDRWKRIWIPLMLGFFMSWSYSNPHFLLLPAFAFGLVKVKENPKLAFAIPAVAAAGIIMGFTLHPQFPNTFINWKIQCIDVMLASLDQNAAVVVGSELSPGSLSFFSSQILLCVIFIANLIMFLKYIKYVKFVNASKPLLAFLFMSTITFLGIFAAIRSVEYAVPFTIITTGLLVKEYTEHHIYDFSGKVHLNILKLAISAIIILTVFRGAAYYRFYKTRQYSAYSDIAEWLLKHRMPPGTIIGNVNWSDFPRLFAVAPQYNYLAGIDPMFAYWKNPEQMKAIELFRTGKKLLAPEQLKAATGTRFIFVSKYNYQLAADMFKLGYVAIYQGTDGNLFDLDYPQ